MRERENRFAELREMTHAALTRRYRSLNPTYSDDENPPESWPVDVLLDGILSVEFAPDVPAERYRFAVGDPVVLDGLQARVTTRTWFKGDGAPHYQITSFGSLWISENTMVSQNARER